MYKTLMIVNLEAGTGKFEKQLSFVVMELKNKEFDVTIKYVDSETSAEKIINNCNIEYDLLVVCGDGTTLNQVTTAITLAGKNISLAYIPTGVANDFAKSIKLPKNGVKIAQNILNSKAFQTDTGTFNNDFYNSIAVFGAFSNISYTTPKEKVKKMGKFAYILNAFKQIKEIRPFRVKAVFDNEVIEDEYIFGSISNSAYIGGKKFFKDNEVSLNDGMFEVLLIKKPQTFFGYFGIIFSILIKDYSRDKNILFSQDKELKLIFDEAVEWNIDGQYAGKHKNINLGMINKNMEFLVI